MKLKPSQTRVIDFLRSYTDPKTGACTPDKRLIAKAVGLSPRRVTEITSELAKLGVIEKVPGYRFYWDDGDVGFTTEAFEAQGASEWWCSSNLYRVLASLLVLAVLWSATLAEAAPASYLRCIMLGIALAAALVLLLQKFYNSGDEG